LAGASATATAAACANLLLEPMTNVSKVYLEFSRVPPSRGAGGIAPGGPSWAGWTCGAGARPPSREPCSSSGTCGPARPASRGPAGSGGRSVPGPEPATAACGDGSTVTASWMSRPSCWDRAWVTRARSLVSSCSLTNSFGVAIRAVFSTSPSGRVSFSQARWCGWICRSASPSRDRAQTSARSEFATCALPRIPVASRALTIHRTIHMLCTWHPRCTPSPGQPGENSFPQPKSRQRGTPGKRRCSGW